MICMKRVAKRKGVEVGDDFSSLADVQCNTGTA